MSSTIWTGVHCISSKCLLQKSFDWKLRATTRVRKTKCVYNFASVPGDPIIGLCSKCPRHTCWRATQASSHLDLKLPQNCATKKFRKLSLDSVFPCFSLFSSALSTVILKDAISAQHIQTAQKLAKCRFTKSLNVMRLVRCGCAGK